MKIFQGALSIDTDRCKGCGLCVEVCPFNLLQLSIRKVNKKGYPFVEQPDYSDCTGCTSCAVVCPDACISVYRKKIDA